WQADRAEDDVAGVHPHPEAYDRIAARRALLVQPADAVADRESRARGRRGAVRWIAERAEDRHEAVAEELVEDAPGVEHALRHDSQVRVQDGDDLLGRERLGERGRAAQIREEDRHGLPLALEPERIAGDDALDHRGREEALEAAPAVELDEERAGREDRRDEHEAVVLPPRRRPGRPEELRYLRLREEDVRDRERALQRQLRAQEIAALRE